MKKLIMFIAIASLSNIYAETHQLDIGDCVLIKENKLKNYLPEEKVNDFLSQPFNVHIVDDGKLYVIELQNSNKKKRYKQYKVCVSKNK